LRKPARVLGGSVLVVAVAGLALGLLEPATARSTCPVSVLHEISPAFGPALGRGPVYAIGFSSGSTLTFEYPPSPTSLFAGDRLERGEDAWSRAGATRGRS
jgi:hypothetical protein